MAEKVHLFCIYKSQEHSQKHLVGPVSCFGAVELFCVEKGHTVRHLGHRQSLNLVLIHS